MTKKEMDNWMTMKYGRTSLSYQTLYKMCRICMCLFVFDDVLDGVKLNQLLIKPYCTYNLITSLNVILNNVSLLSLDIGRVIRMCSLQHDSSYDKKGRRLALTPKNLGIGLMMVTGKVSAFRKLFFDQKLCVTDRITNYNNAQCQ